MMGQERRRGRLNTLSTSAFKYEHRPWTVAEDKRVLAHDIPDSELSPIIKRSMKSISNRRWRLRKAASENKRTGKAGE